MPPKTHPEDAVPRVIIFVSGGVADVLFKPAGVAVSIFDYDTDGADDGDRLSKDPDGQSCCISAWPPSALVAGHKHWPLIKKARRSIEATSSRSWKCPDCQRAVRCSYEALADAGSPYCPDCGVEMALI